MLIDVIYRATHSRQHFCSILTATQINNALNRIWIVIELEHAKAWCIANFYPSDITNPNGYAIINSDNDLLDIVDVFKKAHTANDELLFTTRQ